MAATTPPIDLTQGAPDFALPGVDGQIHKLADLAGDNGLVIAFICNHCPYVIAIADRLVEDAVALQGFGINLVAICANDSAAYPQDSFENMKLFAARHNFGFPYLHDATQDVARAYGAVCTPDFFGFDRDMNLKYRGRLDIGRKDPPPDGAPRDLVNAMANIAETGEPPSEQFPSIGCSIKWKD